MILADESVDGEVVGALRADGHDVIYVAELSPGVSDEEVCGCFTVVTQAGIRIRMPPKT